MNSPTAERQRREADRRTGEILESVRRELSKVPAAELAGIRNVAALGSKMVAMIPQSTGSSLGTVIGPVYSTNALTTMWGITRQAVSKRAFEGHLFAVKVEWRDLFPVFQFDGRRVREDVLRIVGILRGSADPVTIAQWLRTPQIEAEDRTPLELLDDREATLVEDLAKRNAARWSA